MRTYLDDGRGRRLELLNSGRDSVPASRGLERELEPSRDFGAHGVCTLNGMPAACASCGTGCAMRTGEAGFWLRPRAVTIAVGSLALRMLGFGAAKLQVKAFHCSGASS